MTQTIRSADGFSWPTTTSENIVLGPDLDAPESAPDVCEIYNFEDHTPPEPPAPAKHTQFDALVARWEQDEQRRNELEDARRWLADAFHGEVGDTVRTLRLRKGWSQARLAQELETSQSHIARIERGTENLYLKTCRQLCRALDIDMNALDRALARQEAIFQSKANRK